MARHAEIKEKEIIEAGCVIQQRGKVPNPGAIRAQLGFRGCNTPISSSKNN